LNVLRRRSLIFLISDFIDNNYQHNLKALARKHDLIVIHLYDSREVNLPGLGIIPLYDAEKKTTVWVNTSSNQYRKEMANRFRQKKLRTTEAVPPEPSRLHFHQYAGGLCAGAYPFV
jgi:hypothetical protein